MSAPNIEINAEFQKALNLMEAGSANVFLTGKAGTGKSTLLEYFRRHTKKNVVVLAPTGVAAVNVNGATIHSFFGFKPAVTLDKIKKLGTGRQKLYKRLNTVVIDEISMIRADLLDCVDKFLRLNGKNSGQPFGGAQMIFIGDLYQLPPVTLRDEQEVFRSHYESPYFFSAHAFKSARFEFIELEKIYRQKDPVFIELLNVIRNNNITDEALERLNQRVRPGFDSPAGDFYIHLTTTNALADEINGRKLGRINQAPRTYQGEIKGDFDKKYLPAAETLVLKPGSQVMLLNNDPDGRWVNGTMGRIEKISRQAGAGDAIWVKLQNGETTEVLPYKWQISRYLYDEAMGAIRSEPVGSFRQYPLRLAWAVTIHKSQGKTFDKVVVDLRHAAFAPGQIYVALSRCRSLDGIVLEKPLQKKHIFLDWRIVQFMTRFQYSKSEESLPLEKKVELIRRAIETRQSIQITYLKNSNEKSRRVVTPEYVGEMEYEGKKYLGLTGHDSLRQNQRTFRVDRILELALPAKFSG